MSAALRSARRLAIVAALLPLASASGQGLALEQGGFFSGGESSGGGLAIVGILGQPTTGRSIGELLAVQGGIVDGVDPSGRFAHIATRPGPASVRLDWQAEDRGAGAGFTVYRRVAGPTPGALTLVGTVAFRPDQRYTLVDTAAPSGSDWEYWLFESYGATLQVARAAVDGRAYGTTLPAHMARVGAPGGFATIGAAIAAAPSGASRWYVSVAPGTYPPFVVDATAPADLRIVGDGMGEVLVDGIGTGVRIAGRASPRSTLIAGITIRASGADALEVAANQAPLVLADLRVESDRRAVAMVDSQKVWFDRCRLVGSEALRMTRSRAELVHTAVGGMSLAASTTTEAATTVELPITVDASSSRDVLTGATLRVESIPYAALDAPFAIELHDGAPGAAYTLFVSAALDHLALPILELPLLVGLGALIPVQSGALSASGEAEATLVAAGPGTGFLGAALQFQAIAIDATQPIPLRASGTTAVVIMPD